MLSSPQPRRLVSAGDVAPLAGVEFGRIASVQTEVQAVGSDGQAGLDGVLAPFNHEQGVAAKAKKALESRGGQCRSLGEKLPLIRKMLLRLIERGCGGDDGDPTPESS